ncbi:FAD-dependent oxidoreductase [Rhodococcus fascians]|nr:FAD-dependent oxidoreductase [Rhodococcus fascians]MBY4061024.1 FAD-dependent oxidoreductase [Rhodococcus fascians]MBY4071171.1 FAD-dependent oxidoreductase [Rhodococcus fascians]
MNMEKFDLVVIGSGGAGLVAACRGADAGLRVMVAEAQDTLGGTTSWSGGQMWVPNSPPMRRAGFDDDAHAAREYLDRVTLGRTPGPLLDAFVAQAPKMIDYLESDLSIPMASIERHDYHPDWAGARFGRTVEPHPVAAAELGEWAERTNSSPTRRPTTSWEARTGIDPDILQEREADDVRTQGSALAAGLVRAALARTVEFRTGLRITSVQSSADGFRLFDDTGDVVAETPTIVLAAGGFAHNQQWRRRLLPLVTMNPTGPPGGNGDGIDIGVRLGGQLRDLAEAWWTPSAATPTGKVPYRNIVRELAFPGSIIVNGAGRRFVDEASSYNDSTKAMMEFDARSHQFPNAAAWLVFDAEFRQCRTVAGVSPTMPTPFWMIEADSIESLAQRAGIDAHTLAETVAATNRYAQTGTDPEFGRGHNPHDRFNGDETHAPNPCLGPIVQGPYYAVQVDVGVNGTKGGLVVDEYSRVLDGHNEPIPGVFAVGETAAALMGPGYAGSGASLGPALTAAYAVGAAISRPLSELNH